MGTRDKGQLWDYNPPLVKEAIAILVLSSSASDYGEEPEVTLWPSGKLNSNYLRLTESTAYSIRHFNRCKQISPG